MNIPFEHLDDCNFNHYSLQLNIYATLLKKTFPDIEIEPGRLVYFPRGGSYKILKIKDLSQEAETLVNRRVDEQS